MKKELILHYEAVLTKYNFGQPFASKVKHYQNEPNEKDLMLFLDEFNKGHTIHEHCETDIRVSKLYKVIDVQVVESVRIIVSAWTNIPGTNMGTAIINGISFETVDKGDEYRYITSNDPTKTRAADGIVGRFGKDGLKFDMGYSTTIISEL